MNSFSGDHSPITTGLAPATGDLCIDKKLTCTLDMHVAKAITREALKCRYDGMLGLAYDSAPCVICHLYEAVGTHQFTQNRTKA